MIKTSHLLTTAAIALTSLSFINTSYANSESVNANLVESSKQESPQAKVTRLENDIADLQTYQKHLEQLLISQQQDKQKLEQQSEAGKEIAQSLVPFLYQMLDDYQQLINQGTPVQKTQRMQRLEALQALMKRADVSDAEKFRRLLEAYQIEIDYGMKIGRYTDSIVLDSQDQRQVDIFYFGYLTLLARSQNNNQVWLWQQQSKQWQTLTDFDGEQLEKAYLLADKQQTPSLLSLPISLSNVVSFNADAADADLSASSADKSSSVDKNSMSTQATTDPRQSKEQQADEKTVDTSLALEQRIELLLERKAEPQAQNTQLLASYNQNESELVEHQQQNQQQLSQLIEVSSFSRSAAKELQENYQASYLAQNQLTTGVDSKNSNNWQAVIATDNLVNMTQLKSLVQAMKDKIQLSRQLNKVNVSFVQGDGKVSVIPALQLGDMALLTGNGYVNWNYQTQQASAYNSLPDNTPTLEQIEQIDQALSTNQAATRSILLDPMRGELLENFSAKPTLWQRIALAGGVGKVILALLIIGLIIAIYRGLTLLNIQRQVNRQLKQPDVIDNNPLGRILSVYDKEKSQSIETLELRLLESILDEQQGLERGLSMLKLLAALAPMLGLLGTVTGMIETFQVITEFGNGDPKIMAGGISMALMTTVLGLVAAMPLLLAHNVLSSVAEDIHGTLERQGVSLVANRAEQDLETTGE